jgi:GT2 family glycosyltransferase/SAM-dependent methyltransferase
MLKNVQMSTPTSPVVSVVIPTFGQLHLTKRCLDSLLERTTTPFEIVVVDNASPDGTPEYLLALSEDNPNVIVILNDVNRGFAGGTNQGIERSTGQFVVLLNNDTIVPNSWEVPLLAHAANPDIGIVGAVSNFVANEALRKVPQEYGADWERYATDLRTANAGKCFDIDMVVMFCAVLRRDVIESVGLLDEGYGLGMFEDDDYSARVRAAGLRVVCAEDGFVYHEGQGTFRFLVQDGTYDTLFETNRHRFEQRWGAWTAPAMSEAAFGISTSTLESVDDQLLTQLAAERGFRDRSIASGLWQIPAPHGLDFLLTAIDSQGLAFMGDMFPAISQYLRSLQFGSTIRILDVGAGSAAGSNWLAQILAGSFLGVHAEVTAMDASPHYYQYATVFRNSVRYISGKLLADLPRNDLYDVVISSHVVEHVDDPAGFVMELRQQCRGRVFVYAPFEEQEPIADGHVNRFTRPVVDEWDPLSVDIVTSLAWRKEATPTDLSRCFLAQFSGLAT